MTTSETICAVAEPESAAPEIDEWRFLATLEAVSTPMVMIDNSGRIVLVTSEMENLFGYTREELLGQPVEVLVPHHLRLHHAALRDGFCDDPKPRRLGYGRDVVGLHKDGHEIPVEIGVNPIHTPKGMYVLAVIVDLSQRKREEALRFANQELEQYVQKRTAELVQSNKELERSNQDLEQFAYVASHDLQEPLRKVSACCQALAEDYTDKLDDNAREWIDLAVDGAKRMSRLVSDLLTYSRVGKRQGPIVASDVHAACQLAVKCLAQAVEESGVEIVCHPLPRVMADENQLVQLFQNLVGNSIKYRGTAPLRIEIGAEADGDMHRMYVKDNGIGMDPRYHERIFEIFQRLHNKNEYSGTGIGLAICKKIIQRLGGEIWVESSVGNGSTFYFTLPKPKELQA